MPRKPPQAKKKPAPSKRSAGKPAGGQKAGPKLLAGGNPQIAKGDGDGPLQAYIGAMPDWKRAIGEQVDAIVTAAVPGVVKAVKWNSPFYGMTEHGWFLSFHCFTRYVKLTFFNGSSLTPPPPGQSSSPAVRFWDIHEGETIDAKQLAKWVKQASQRTGWGRC